MFTFSQAQLEGKIRCLETAKILNKVLPGFESSFITRIAPELGIRITRTIKGQKEIKLEDLKGPYTCSDVIGIVPGWKFSKNGKGIADFTVDLPLGILIPKNVDNLIVGRGEVYRGGKP
jgi:hypothetical protein